MSQKEVKRAQVLDRLKEGKISQQQASKQFVLNHAPLTCNLEIENYPAVVQISINHDLCLSAG